LACLSAHLHFRPAIEQLTAVTSNKLKAYQLTEEQWNLAQQLSAILQVSGVTICFIIYLINIVIDF
jgi:hypothetical protein